MEFEQTVIIHFLYREGAEARDIQTRLRHSLGMPPAACEASSVGVCMFDKGASF
jgi:hypothetical protein